MSVSEQQISPTMRTAGDGFVQALLTSIHRLLIKGATPVEIDEVLEAFGFKMGPLEAQDLTGLEKAYLDRKARVRNKKSKAYLESGLMISDRMVQEGRLGKISGVGWYRYPGGKGKVEDPLIEDLIREEAYFAKIEQQSFKANDIVSFSIDALAKEMKRICDMQDSLSAEAVEQICINSTGFPPEKIILLRELIA